MKPRKVTITLEVITDAPLGQLKKISAVLIEPAGFRLEVDQSQANVIKPAANSSEPK